MHEHHLLRYKQVESPITRLETYHELWRKLVVALPFGAQCAAVRFHISGRWKSESNKTKKNPISLRDESLFLSQIFSAEVMYTFRPTVERFATRELGPTYFLDCDTYENDTK